MPAEGLKGHVATDGSSLGSAGKWGACGWAAVQLDFGGEMVPLRGMYGSVEAEFEVQRTIKRAELMAFLCSKKSDWASQGPCRQRRNYRWITKRRELMFEAKSGRCRFIDQNLGRRT